MATIRIKLADQGEITHELTAGRISIGRRPDNTVQIIDRSVSAHHAELIYEDGHYRLHDLGSTNLTFIEGTAVMDYHLHKECRIIFGTVQCDFDPQGGGDGLPRMTAAQLEKDLAYMRGENADLQGQIVGLQRQIDILSTARLLTKKADNAPVPATDDALKAIVSERDDLRHLTAGLKFELEKVREELAATTRERDAARQACELLQAERVTDSRELQDFRKQTGRLEAPTNGSSPRPAAESGPTSSPGPSGGDTVMTVAAALKQTTVVPSPNAAAAKPNATPRPAAETPAESTQKITLPLPPCPLALHAIDRPRN